MREGATIFDNSILRARPKNEQKKDLRKDFFFWLTSLGIKTQEEDPLDTIRPSFFIYIMRPREVIERHGSY
jgi:hypothetical protein